MSDTTPGDELRQLWERILREEISSWDGFKEETANFVVVQRDLFMAFTYADSDRDVIVHMNRYIHQNIMEVVKIRIGESMRGKGLGASLYDVLLSFGSRTGVDYLRLYPSGTAKTQHKDKSRLAYMLRRGWVMAAGDDPDPEVVKRCRVKD